MQHDLRAQLDCTGWRRRYEYLNCSQRLARSSRNDKGERESRSRTCSCIVCFWFKSLPPFPQRVKHYTHTHSASNLEVEGSPVTLLATTSCLELDQDLRQPTRKIVVRDGNFPDRYNSWIEQSFAFNGVQVVHCRALRKFEHSKSASKCHLKDVIRTVGKKFGIVLVENEG